MSSDLNLNSIGYQDKLRSKPIRLNFSNIQNEFNSLRSEVQNTLSSTASEVTSARDGFTSLQDNIHIRRMFGGGVNTGGLVTAKGTPDNEVLISAGSGIVNGEGVDWSAATSNSIAAVTNTSRKNVVVINSDDTLSVELGDTVSTTDILPELANTMRPLAIISQDTASPAVIQSADITDIRGQGCLTNLGNWYFKIQDAIDSLNGTLGGTIHINQGRYYEEIDLAGKNNVKLIGEGDVRVYRPGNAYYALKSVNTTGSVTEGNEINNLRFYGNGMTGAIELVSINFTDKFKMIKCEFDGNASATGITYKNYKIRNSDKFILSDNTPLDASGNINYGSTSTFSTCTEYIEDGHQNGDVKFCGTTGQKTECLRRGWVELTAMDNKFLRIDKDTAAGTGGNDSSAHTHSVAGSHTHSLAGSHTHSHSHTSNLSGGSFNTPGVNVGAQGSSNNPVVTDGGGGPGSYTILQTGTNTDSTTAGSGNTGTAGSGSTGGASATDNKPAYYTLIALIHR